MSQDDELQKILNQHFPPSDHDQDDGGEESRGGSKWIASLFALLFAAGAVGLMIYGYNWWQKQRVASDADMPVITGPEEAIKTKPSDPGGMNIPHQDATIYDELNNKTADSEEKLLPTAEEPTGESNLVLSDSEDAPPLISDADAAKVVQNNITEPTPIEPAPIEPPTAAKPVETTETVTAPTVPAETKKLEQLATPTKAPVKAKVETAPAKKAASGDAVFNIQLAAVRDDAGLADKEWANIKGRVGGLLNGLNTVSPRVKVGEHTMVRLQAGPLTREAGEALCAKLKAKNQACMLVHR